MGKHLKLIKMKDFNEIEEIATELFDVNIDQLYVTSEMMKFDIITQLMRAYQLGRKEGLDEVFTQLRASSEKNNY